MASQFRIANTPASWGVLEFGLEGQTPGWAQVLDEMSATGYRGTELGDWGFLPSDPALLASELSRRGLQLVAGFVPVALSQPGAWPEGQQRALRTARLLAAVGGEHATLVLADANGTDPLRTANAGRVTPAMALDETRWQLFSKGTERIARVVRDETGLGTAFHHHCGGYVETPEEIARLMAMTDSALVGLCLDTGHCMWGGGDPLDVLRDYQARIIQVHFKDCSPRIATQALREDWDYFEAVGHGVFCELGQGAVPFEAIRDALITMHYDGWVVVEQDVLPALGSPLASARRNHDYMARLGMA